MDSKTRFKVAMNHQRGDRVPIDYQGTALVTKNLKKHFGITTERELLDILRTDFYYLSFRDLSQNEQCLPFYKGPKLHFTETERTCPLGIRYRRQSYDDKFGSDETIAGPFENITSTRQILDHPWPKPGWFDLEPLIKESEDFSDRVIIGGFWTALFSDCFRLYGYQNFLLDLLMKPEYIKTLVDRTTEFYLEMNESMFSTLKGKMDIFFLGSDFGSQHGLMFDKDLWLEIYYHNYQKIIVQAKSYGLTVMFHSCGSILPLLPYFIELGIDIINPVQTTAADMDPGFLKDNFGRNIVFHGAIDTQNVLPNSTPEEIKTYARIMINILGENGGYLFAPCNTIQPDTSIQNIETLYNTAQEGY